MARTTPAPHADTSSIRTLLANDVARLRGAEEAIVALEHRLNSWTADEGVDPMQLRRELDEQCAHAAEARQSFSARTEMLQYIDLQGVSVEDFIAQALNTPTEDVGAIATPGVSDMDPERTRTIATSRTTPTTDGK